ncbi:hypothetical protein Vadar_005960 [Vaccinium darrowii]|uniref:Uncharacterized protein n=1 Tax=Vaccinium darrowii TaxID=229202 RepID=A0ACB7XPV4_9ERIC|nr:hypothetical protein Vadar_005960 [Vaccinium darrowii]
MAKAVALIALALGVLAMAGHVHGWISPYYGDRTNKIAVEGRVSCATCIASSEADIEGLRKLVMYRPELRAMTPDPIAVVEVLCKSRKTGAVTVKVPGEVDNGGYFLTYVEHGHHDDLCTVRVVNSSHPLCNVKVPGFRSIRISFNNNNVYKDGVDTIYVDRKIFGFVNKKSLPDCPKVRGKRGNMVPTVVMPHWAQSIPK